MNGANDNNIRPDSTEGSREFAKIGPTSLQADTPSGAAWLAKYLHPPRSTPAEYAGIPDKNNMPSAFPEYKGSTDLQTYSVEGTTITNYNKILLLCTSSIIAPVIAFAIDTAGTVHQLPQDVIFNVDINVRSMLNENSSGRISYKSTTTSLNATEFSNQGVVTCAKFRPNITVFRAGDLIEFARSNRVAEQRIDTIKSELTEFFCADQWEDAVDNFVQILKFGQLPTDPSEIMMMSPNATSTLAKNGAFVVQQFDVDSVGYKSFAANGITGGGGVSTLVGIPCYWFAQPGATGTLEPFAVVGQPGNTTSVLADLPWFDMCWSWVLYSGLSVLPAGTSVANSFPPYITVKTITGFEFQPLTDSMLCPFVRNSAVYDMTAIRFASMIQHSKADSLPAAANFWGSIGKILLQAAPTVIDTVKSIFGKKSTEEEKKVTKDTTTSLIKKIEALETKLSEKPRKERKQPPQPAKPQRKPKANPQSSNPKPSTKRRTRRKPRPQNQ